MFESLFKFDPINFAEGSVRLDFGAGSLVAAGVLVLLTVGLFLVYRSSKQYARPRDRALSLSLRALALLLLCLPLFEPVLVVPDVVPDENFVAVVVDASESMSIRDGSEERSRYESAQRLLAEEGLAAGLAEHFKTRLYTFGNTARRVEDVPGESPTGQRTNLTAALDRVLADFRGLPLSGVVLLTDGADNSGGVPVKAASAFSERDVPLHVVGFGRTEFSGERELLEATASRGVEVTTGADIDVRVRSWREESEPVTVRLYRDDEVVQTSRQRLKGDGKTDYFTLYYEPEGPETAEYTLRIEEAPDESVADNNAKDLLISPRDDTLHVLLIEGHLRPEFKFLRRALEDDHAVRVASILRTGSGKFFRQGIRRPEELAGGFPSSVEELFEYDVVLLGDVEAAQFTLEQLEMIERFVRIRGGGFAMLGGRASFAEGAYWDNAIADVLPVSVDPDRRTVLPPSFGDADGPAEAGFTFAPTPEGLESSILRLAADPLENEGRWQSMPGLTSINYLGRPKPGATVLARKPEDDYGATEPLFVVQRYGKGRSAALATASTWRWRMLTDPEDQRHTRFHRQLVRWLGASAPGRVEILLDRNRYAPDEEIAVRVQAYDPTYAPDPDATVRATMTSASGSVEEVRFQPELGTIGSHGATLLPSEEGVHVLDVTVEDASGEVRTDQRSFLIRSSGEEYYDAVLKQSALQQLADAAGGFYYSPEEADVIPTNLRSRRTSTSIYHASYLWDMPALFILAVLLLSGEWWWRRRRSLP